MDLIEEHSSSGDQIEDSFLLNKEKTRPIDSILRKESRENIIPRTLNPRASVQLPINQSPRGYSPSPTSQNRSRAISHGLTLGSRNKNAQSSPPNGTLQRELSFSEEEREDEDRERKALMIKKEFIARQMREKAYGQKKMVSSEFTFLEQPTDSGTLSDFCVTTRSTPCGTPPPERQDSYASNRELANMKVEMRKIKDQVGYMGKQQQDINNYFLEIKKMREEELSKSASFCWWF